MRESKDYDIFYKKITSNIREKENVGHTLFLLNKAVEALTKAINDASNDLPVDLIAVSLTSAYRSILEILGEDMDIDLSKEIFKRFCVGK